jgi:release factor glutamine methyltransferase
LALDIGVGSGIITETLCQNFEYVAATDTVIETLKRCKESIVRYRQSDNNMVSKRDMRFELICTDAASAFRSSTFDLIVSNPPYLPDDYDNEGRKIHDRTIYGTNITYNQVFTIIVKERWQASDNCFKFV